MCHRLQQAVVWKRNEFWKTNSKTKSSHNIYPRITSSNNEYLPQVLVIWVHSKKEMNIVTLQLSFRLQYHSRIDAIVLPLGKMIATPNNGCSNTCPDRNSCGRAYDRPVWFFTTNHDLHPNSWANNRDGDVARHRAHYDVIVMLQFSIPHCPINSKRLFFFS